MSTTLGNGDITFGDGTVISDGYVSGGSVTTPFVGARFSSIPTWANRITILFENVLLSGTDDVLIQVGYGTSVPYTTVTSGYVSTGSSMNYSGGTTSTAGRSSTTGLILFRNTSAYTLSGSATLIRDGTTYSYSGPNSWTYSAVIRHGTTNVGIQGGHITGLLYPVSLIDINPSGTNTFTQGSIHLLYD